MMLALNLVINAKIMRMQIKKLFYSNISLPYIIVMIMLFQKLSLNVQWGREYAICRHHRARGRGEMNIFGKRSF